MSSRPSINTSEGAILGAPGSPWISSEVATVMENYATLGPKACLVLLPGRKDRTLRAFASFLGLKFSTLPDKERFESKFRVTPSCWIWQKGLDSDGYGQFGAGGKNLAAHRYAFALYVGEIPCGMSVCHKCDNPRCVNPAHLWLGTNQDNTADRHQKGRSARNFKRAATLLPGVANGFAKLNDSAVRAIRSDGRSYRVIGKEFGVSSSTVSRIKGHQGWRHVR